MQAFQTLAGDYTVRGVSVGYCEIEPTQKASLTHVTHVKVKVKRAGRLNKALTSECEHSL